MAFQETQPGTLQAFETPEWKVVLPRKAAGLAPIPGGAGGAFVGLDPRNGGIAHFTREGLLVGMFKPQEPFVGNSGEGGSDLATGALDSLQSLNCHRGPDGLLDLFAQDNVNGRILWYRVDDQRTEYRDSGPVSVQEAGGGRQSLVVNSGIGSGSYPAGTVVVHVIADAPPAGREFAGWTGGAVADPSAPETTLVVPSGGATVSATYGWAGGNDEVRFLPYSGAADNLIDSVFEGTNGDPVKGPYSPFFEITANPGNGWTSASVNMGNFRYVRWRSRRTANMGVLSEIEFRRGGLKMTGPSFGTDGLEQRTFDRVFDRDSSTYFVWKVAPDSGPYAGIDTRQTALSLVVQGGSGSGSYDAGTSVLVSAGQAAPGQEFAMWTGDTAILSNRWLATTSATVPWRDVVITATYRMIPHNLSVIGGLGGGTYVPGESVAVSAGPPPSGQEFAGWIGDTAVVADPAAANTTVRMPATDATITAGYRVSRYSLLVSGGSGSGTYPAGNTIAVSANAAPAGEVFVRWAGDTGILLDPQAATTATMPAAGASIAAINAAPPSTPSQSTPGTGLRARYYNLSSQTSYPPANPFAGTPVVTRIDPTVSFGWYIGSPDPRVTVDNFSARWTGKLKAPASGRYLIKVVGDDGVRLLINGAIVIGDAWKDQGFATYTYGLDLTAGTFYDIELQYYEHGGGAACILSWIPPGQSEQSIPQAQLYPDEAQGMAAFSLAVQGGSGGGTYPAGATVTVSANAAPNGQQFAGWTGDTGVLLNPQGASTTVTIPPANVSITASYAATTTSTRLSGSATASHFVHGGERPEFAFDGSTATKWCALAEGAQWLRVDLGSVRSVSRFVVRHANAGGEGTLSNTRDFRIQKSDNGNDWSDVVVVSGNAADVTIHSVTPQTARYLRLYVTKATSHADKAVRIYEFEIWGS